MDVHKIEILLPVRDNEGVNFPDSVLMHIRAELVRRFGGLTAFVQHPATGIWATQEGNQKDQLVILEVMAEVLDYLWWADFRTELESQLRQEEIVIRAHPIERL